MEPQANGRVDFLHDELRDLRSYMTTRFDLLEDRISKLEKRIPDNLDGRLRALEAWQSRVMGIAAAVAALVSMGWSWLTGKRS